MAYFSRAQWGARGVSLQGMNRPAPDVWIHHTVGEPGGDEARFMRETEAFHVNSRGMRAIAYSFIVMPSGNVYEGRGWDKVGGHTINRNSTSHAVCFAGNFENHPPTQAALEGAAWIIREGLSRGSVVRKRQPTGGHRDVDSTACPGRHLYSRLDDLRGLVASGPSAPAPSPERKKATLFAIHLKSHAQYPNGALFVGTSPLGLVEVDLAGYAKALREHNAFEVKVDAGDFDRWIRFEQPLPVRWAVERLVALVK